MHRRRSSHARKERAVARGDRAPRRKPRRSPAQSPHHAGRQLAQHRHVFDHRHRVAGGQGAPRSAARNGGWRPSSGPVGRPTTVDPENLTLVPGETVVTTPIVVIAVTLAYLALASLSSALTMVAADAWTVWLASGLILGLLLTCRRDKWVAILAGAAIGAAAFSFLLGDLSAFDAAGYAAIEVLTALAGAFVFVWLAPAPTRLETPRELAALFALALVLAVLGGALAAAWSLAAASDPAMRTFRVWMIANLVGTILVAPLVIAWSGFRPNRPGGLTMTEFVAGAGVA